MKKLLLLLLIPFVSFGQDFRLKDLKLIDSKIQYKRFGFEQGFDQDMYEGVPIYAFNLDKSKKTASIWFLWYQDGLEETFGLDFAKNNGVSQPLFNEILEEVLNQCSFYDFKIFDWNDEFACYTCPDAKYEGKICFKKGEKYDVIQTFIFD